jgi:hypothetical protein
MPKRITTTDAAARAFGRRLTKLLADSGQPRRGAGAYLAKRYKVATVTANAWLNGEYKANTTTARQIAVDHGGTFDELYFGAPAIVARIDADHHSQSLRLDPRTLRLTHRALREMFHDAKLGAYNLEADPALFLQVYEIRSSMSDEPSESELIAFGAKLEKLMTPQGAEKDGRGDDRVPAKGTSKGKVSGKVRREA